MFLFIPHFLYIFLFLSTIPLPLRLPLPLSPISPLSSPSSSPCLSLSLTISYTRSVTHSIPQSLAILLSHSRLSYLSCCLAFIKEFGYALLIANILDYSWVSYTQTFLAQSFILFRLLLQTLLRRADDQSLRTDVFAQFSSGPFWIIFFSG